MNEFTIMWRSNDNEEYSELDTNEYFATLVEAQQDIKNIDVKKEFLYWIAEVDTESGDVINSYSVLGGKAFPRTEDTGEEILATK